MSKDKISDYSETPGNNTDIGGINIAEGMLPSDVNNAIREQMAQLKKFQSGTSGESVTFATVRVVTSINDTNGNELFGVTATGSAVNEFTVANAATGNAPTLSATGGDTNIGMALTPKGTGGVIFPAGAVGTPSITTTGDLNTGIFFPAADTIAFTEGGAEAMRIDSSGNVGIGTTSPNVGSAGAGNRILTLTGALAGQSGIIELQAPSNTTDSNAAGLLRFYNGTNENARIEARTQGNVNDAANLRFATKATGGSLNERMRIDSSGNVGIGTTSPVGRLSVLGADNSTQVVIAGSTGGTARGLRIATTDVSLFNDHVIFDAQTSSGAFRFQTNGTERARITSGGQFLVGQTSNNSGVAGHGLDNNGFVFHTRDGGLPLYVNRLTNDGNLVELVQDNITEGAISVSGNTVTYGAFCGGHWTQLQEGRGYNPEIPRGTVMSSIGEMAVWKSVEWTETVEHPAIEAVEAKEAVLDEDGNVIEPAVEAVEGKDAWTESIPHRESYLGNLDIGETFEEDGFTKTVVDDGNERLPKVKISDVVGDKAVYGVFQTWDDVEDMLITSLGAFVVRIAAGVTVEIGDLLESNGDGCAKVQDDDIIRSKTIGKVTSTVATDTYDDGSYTVPCVIYCG